MTILSPIEPVISPFLVEQVSEEYVRIALEKGMQCYRRE